MSVLVDFHLGSRNDNRAAVCSTSLDLVIFPNAKFLFV